MAPAPRKSSDTYAACHKVLNTTELREAVILHLPPINIFGVRRVSRQWLNTILSSPRIQQTTFLSAVPEPERWIARATVNLHTGFWEPRHHDYELVLAPTGDYERLHYVEGVAKEFCTMRFTPTKLCPLLQFDFGKGVAWRTIEQCTDDYVQLQMHDHFKRDGSWQNMLLTNPRCKFVALDTTVMLDTTPATKITARTMITNPDGFTLGGIVKEAFAEPAYDLQTKKCAGDSEVGEVVEECEPKTKSVNEAVEAIRSMHGQQIQVLSSNIGIELKLMALTSDEEEQEMREKGRLIGPKD